MHNKVGRLPAGSIFGDEEILKRMNKRKFSVKAYQPNTLLYIIQKKSKKIICKS